MDRGAWRATVHGITKSQTQLSDQASMEGNYEVFHCWSDIQLTLSNAEVRSTALHTVRNPLT